MNDPFATCYSAKNKDDFDQLVYGVMNRIKEGEITIIPQNKWTHHIIRTLKEFIGQGFLPYELEFNNNYSKIRKRGR